MTPSESEIRALVRQALQRLSATPPSRGTEPPSAARTIIDADFIQALPASSSYSVSPDALITPLARDVARERRIELLEEDITAPIPSRIARERLVAIAADHGGFALKEELKPYLRELGYEPVDLGTHSTSSVDYPDFALAAARMVAQDRCNAAIIIDGAGIGSCMAANKVPGIRASMCYDISTAQNAREHNHANVLTLGAGLIGSGMAKQIVKTWLTTSWGGERHARRVDKISQIERRFWRY